MQKLKSRLIWGTLILILIFGIDAAAGNQIFDALWKLGTILVDGAIGLLGAVGRHANLH